MIDLGSVAGAFSTLNSARQMFSAAVGIRDEANRIAALNGASAELSKAYEQILELRVAIATANAEHQTLLTEKRDLEEKIRELERARYDFARYRLHELSVGVFVYAVGASENGIEPAHYLCARCRNSNKKSILNRVETQSQIFHECPEVDCKAQHLERKKELPPLPIERPRRI